MVKTVVFISIYLSLQLNWVADCTAEFTNPLDFFGNLRNMGIRSNALEILPNILT